MPPQFADAEDAVWPGRLPPRDAGCGGRPRLWHLGRLPLISEVRLCAVPDLFMGPAGCYSILVTGEELPGHFHRARAD